MARANEGADVLIDANPVDAHLVLKCPQSSFAPGHVHAVVVAHAHEHLLELLLMIGYEYAVSVENNVVRADAHGLEVRADPSRTLRGLSSTLGLGDLLGHWRDRDVARDGNGSVSFPLLKREKVGLRLADREESRVAVGRWRERSGRGDDGSGAVVRDGVPLSGDPVTKDRAGSLDIELIALYAWVSRVV
jgi:hypothetical protein